MGVLVVSFLIIPIVVTLRPVWLVGFRTTYLVLPMIPAVLLGLVAVWSMTAATDGSE